MNTDASHDHPPSEERDVLTEFGDAYALYAGKTPAFVLRIFGQRPADKNSVYGKHRL
jgi:hypothetical protein